MAIEGMDDMDRRADPRWPKALILLLPLILLATAPSSQGLVSDGFAGTTYILGRSEAEAIVPANGTSFDLTLPYKVEIILFDSQGSTVPVETEVQFWRGSYRYQVVSHRPVRGQMSYTIPISEQRFVAPVEEGESVRVVLPEGYATGDRILGRARPDPDAVGTLDGRTTLIWTDPEKRAYIDVSFYREGAPRAFRLFLLLLAFIAGVLVLEHNMSIKRLRSFREDAEIEGAEEEGDGKELERKDRRGEDRDDEDLEENDGVDKDRDDKGRT